jgi:hypothetical protein
MTTNNNNQNTSSEKIGELIIRLFGGGFSHEAIQFITDPENIKKKEVRQSIFGKFNSYGYYELTTKPCNNENGDDKDIFSECKKYQSDFDSIRRKIKSKKKCQNILTKNRFESSLFDDAVTKSECDNKWYQNLAKDEIENYKNLRNEIKDQYFKLKGNELDSYIIPPSNPFDMFAICSTLLLKSGAFHHIEYQFGGIKQVEQNNKPNQSERDLQRRIKVDNKMTKHWGKIAKHWRKSESILCFILVKDESNYPSFSTQFSEILEQWLKLLECWKSPIHITQPENEPAPKWWEAAYILMLVADEAAKSVGFHSYSQDNSHKGKN